MYSREFRELVAKGVQENFYIGTGNPNARILFVGKEAAICSAEEQNYTYYLSNAQNWEKHLKENTCEILSFTPKDKDKSLRMAGHTWRKYQKLHNYIFDKSQNENDKFKIDFLENVFTTEMSDGPSKRTFSAKKKKDFNDLLDQRRNTFFKSDFIKQFPVIVLACSDYIKNEKENYQINDTFNVSFSPSETTHDLPFWIHYSEKKDRLIIHTHQLSSSLASNKLLENIGKVIREFMISNNLLLSNF